MDFAYWQQVVPLTMIFIIFYVLVIRPPRVVEARRFAAVMAARVGDEVVLVSGAHGWLVETGSLDDPFLVEIADGVRITVSEFGIKAVHPAAAARRWMDGDPRVCDRTQRYAS